MDVKAFVTQEIAKMAPSSVRTALQDLVRQGFDEPASLVETIKTIPDSDMRKALGALTQKWLDLLAEERINSLPDDNLKKVFHALTADGKRSLDAMEKKLASYYDTTMERVTGWYKRRMQVVLFFIGLVVCAFLNIDIFVMVPLLHHDAHLASNWQASQCRSAHRLTRRRWRNWTLGWRRSRCRSAGNYHPGLRMHRVWWPLPLRSSRICAVALGRSSRGG